MSDFGAIQQRFYNNIVKCRNPTDVKLIFVKVTSEGELSEFLGDNKREADKIISLKCRYQRYLNDKQREKAGVTEEVDMSVFISPIELEQKTGSFELPEQFRSSYSGVAVEIFNQHHEVESIRDLEPQQRLGRVTCVALQINLKRGKGNTDFN